jgi:hypothetical protein
VNAWAGQDRLAAFRGGFPPGPLDTRRVAGLLDVPGCVRRQVVDAAGVSMDTLAGLLGCPTGGQSPFAIARARQFEKAATEGALGPVLTLVRDRLGAPVTAVRQVDLSAGQVRSQYARGDPDFRARLTRRYVAQMLDRDEAAVNLLRHPVLTLAVGGAPMFVEPDLIGYTSTDPLRPVEIRSYPYVDGLADPAKVSATARELAVHLLAMRELVSGLRHDPTRVGSAGLLVLPRNFSLRATGEVVDVAPQERRLRRALDGFPDPDALVRHLPEGVALPAVPARDAPIPVRAEAADLAAEAVSVLPARFGDGCAGCGLFAHCRREQESSGTVARTGNAAANLCGDVGTLDAALDLAHGARAAATPAERAVAADLTRAAVMAGWARSAL